MREDIKRFSRVLHHVAVRELNDIEVEQLFKLLTDIVNNLNMVLEYDLQKIDYNRMEWITKGKTKGWFGSDEEYDDSRYLADIESLAILFAQMFIKGHLNTDENSERQISKLNPIEQLYSF